MNIIIAFVQLNTGTKLFGTVSAIGLMGILLVISFYPNFGQNHPDSEQNKKNKWNELEK